MPQKRKHERNKINRMLWYRWQWTDVLSLLIPSQCYFLSQFFFRSTRGNFFVGGETVRTSGKLPNHLAIRFAWYTLICYLKLAYDLRVNTSKYILLSSEQKWSVSPKNNKTILIKIEIKTFCQSRSCWVNTLKWLFSMGLICVQPMLISRVWDVMGGFLKRWLTGKAHTIKVTQTKFTQQMRILFSLQSFWASLNIKNHSHPSPKSP